MKEDNNKKENNEGITPEEIDEAVEKYVFSKLEKGESPTSIDEIISRMKLASDVLKLKEEEERKSKPEKKGYDRDER